MAETEKHAAEKDAIDALLLPHSIAGVDNPQQGIAQTVPSPVVLCLSCGWMRVEEYHWHLVDRLAEWLDGVLDSGGIPPAETTEEPR